jgi:hypothetical protein
MKARTLALLFATLTVSAPCLADDAGRGLSIGGAILAGADEPRVTLWNSGHVEAGLGAPSANLLSPLSVNGKGMQMGGFLAWRNEEYRLDATLAPAADGSVTAGFGASTGASPGELGTSYSLRVGADRVGDRFTINPASSLGLTDVVQPNSDVNLTVTINHALTPTLSIKGTAGATRNMGPGVDGGSQKSYLFGAGLGYRF